MQNPKNISCRGIPLPQSSGRQILFQLPQIQASIGCSAQGTAVRPKARCPCWACKALSTALTEKPTLAGPPGTLLSSLELQQPPPPPASRVQDFCVVAPTWLFKPLLLHRIWTLGSTLGPTSGEGLLCYRFFALSWSRGAWGPSWVVTVYILKLHRELRDGWVGKMLTAPS